MDQSKLRTLGHKSNQKLTTGKYTNVSNLVRNTSEFAAGLSEGENSGG